MPQLAQPSDEALRAGRTRVAEREQREQAARRRRARPASRPDRDPRPRPAAGARQRGDELESPEARTCVRRRRLRRRWPGNACAVPRRGRLQSGAGRAKARARADAPIAPRASRRARSPSRVNRPAATRTSAQRDPPLRQRARLVEDDVRHARERLERIRARDHDTAGGASAPAAAASAAGVASDSAHGQDTTSTAKVTASARDGSILPPGDRRDAAKQQQRADEPRCDAVGDARQRAAARLAARSTSRSDRGESRRLAGRGDAQHERPSRTTLPASTASPADLPRPRFAGQDRFLDARAAVDDLAVRGNRSRRPARARCRRNRAMPRRRVRLSWRRASAMRRSAVAGRARATASIGVAGALSRDQLDVARDAAAAR